MIPTYLTTSEKQTPAAAAGPGPAPASRPLKLRVLAAADDIAIETGDRSTAHWLAAQTRDNPGTLRRHAALAEALDQRWADVADAFATGDLNLAQVRVITDALDALPTDPGADLRAKAETLIVTEAATRDPGSCWSTGPDCWSTWPPTSPRKPTTGDCWPRNATPPAATRLSIRRRGDGSADLHARIPDHTAAGWAPTSTPTPHPADATTSTVTQTRRRW